jgi:hypothetical protein
MRTIELPAVFGPDTLRVLSDALEHACQRALASSLILKADDHMEVARMVLAEHIALMARKGEREPQRLIEGALARLRL